MIAIATAVWSSPSTHLRRARGPSRPSRKRLRLPITLTRLKASPPTLLLPLPQVRHPPLQVILPRRRATQRLPLTAALHQPSHPMPPLLRLATPSLPKSPPPLPPLFPLLRTRPTRTSPLRPRPPTALALSPPSGYLVLVSLLPWLVSLRVCSSKIRVWLFAYQWSGSNGGCQLTGVHAGSGHLEYFYCRVGLLPVPFLYGPLRTRQFSASLLQLTEQQWVSIHGKL